MFGNFPMELRFTAFLASSISGIILLISMFAMIQIKQEINEYWRELDLEIGKYRVSQNKKYYKKF